MSDISPGNGRRATDGKKKLLSFKLPFKKASKAENTQTLAGDLKLPPEIRPANSNVSGNRKTLILSGILALGVVAFIVSSKLMAPSAMAPVATPTSIEQPAMVQPEVIAPAPAPMAVAPDAATTSQPVPSPTVPAVEPAPLETSEPKLQQQGENTSAAQPDEILTGSLPAAVAPKSATPITIDVAVGNETLRNAASTGDANAQFVIATRYLNGENVPADASKAAYWYGKAAATGLAPAQYRIATLYERGTGVEKNMQAALSWYERAAALGNVKAMHNAAVISAGDVAGQADYGRAFKWFTLAANHGLKDSQFNLAVLVERGMGTKANLAEALFWYDLAAAQGDDDAKTHADAIAKSLPPEMVKSIEARLKAWKPETAPDIANVVAVNESSWKGANAAPQQAAALAAAQNIIGKAQTLLDKLGYNIGHADGKMGGRTSNAVRLFQLQEGLKVNGQITPELIAEMQSKAS